MKNNRVLFTIIIIAIVILMLFTSCSQLKCNNTMRKEYLITERHPQKTVDEIWDMINLGGTSLEEINLRFNLQCVRETDSGRYAILALENHMYAYIFENALGSVNYILMTDGFKSKDEFAKHITANLTLAEAVMFGNYIPSSVSAFPATAHYVKEGYFLLRYDDKADGKQTISSFEFVENSDVEKYNTIFPIIFEIDK